MDGIGQVDVAEINTVPSVVEGCGQPQQVCMICSDNTQEDRFAEDGLKDIAGVFEVSYESIKDSLNIQCPPDLNTFRTAYCFDCDSLAKYGLEILLTIRNLQKQLIDVRHKLIRRAVKGGCAKESLATEYPATEYCKLRAGVWGTVIKGFSECKIEILSLNGAEGKGSVKRASAIRTKPQLIELTVKEEDRTISNKRTESNSQTEVTAKTQDAEETLTASPPDNVNEHSVDEEAFDQEHDDDSSARHDDPNDANDEDYILKVEEAHVKPNIKSLPSKKKSSVLPTDRAKGNKPRSKKKRKRKKAVTTIVCGLCGVSFVNSAVLRIHRNENHMDVGLITNPVEIFECDICHMRLERNKCVISDGLYADCGTDAGVTYTNFADLCHHHYMKCGNIQPRREKKATYETSAKSRKSQIARLQKKKLLDARLTGGKIMCEWCNEEFSNTQGYDIHKATHYNDIGQILCVACGSNFRHENALLIHIAKTHGLERDQECRFLCRYCQDPYVSTSRSTSDPYEPITNQAGVSGRFAEFTKKHEELCKVNQSSDAAIPKLLLQCSYCIATFKGRAALTNHEIRMHTKEYVCYCDQCGKGFASRNNLLQHLRCHEERRDYLCPICPAGYKHRSRLTEHLRLHTGENPYVCDICGAQFRTITKLKRHEQIHNPEATFACSECNKCFKAKNNLNYHVYMVHKGGKRKPKARKIKKIIAASDR